MTNLYPLLTLLSPLVVNSSTTSVDDNALKNESEVGLVSPLPEHLWVKWLIGHASECYQRDYY